MDLFFRFFSPKIPIIAIDNLDIAADAAKDDENDEN